MATIVIQYLTADVVTMLKETSLALEDPTEFMEDVLLVMIRSTQLTFVEQGRPERWAALANSTIQRRISKTRGGRRARARALNSRREGGARARDAQNLYFGMVGALQILRDTGTLLQSVGGSASGPFSTPDGYGESDQFTATIGTNHPGAYNQFPDPRTGRPERIIFQWLEQDAEDIAGMASDWLLRRGPYALA